MTGEINRSNKIGNISNRKGYMFTSIDQQMACLNRKGFICFLKDFTESTNHSCGGKLVHRLKGSAPFAPTNSEPVGGDNELLCVL